MLNQNFSPETLSKFLHSKRDNRKLKKQSKNSTTPETLTDISYSIDSPDFKFESISTLTINNKTIARIEKFGETLILRKLNDNLKRIYGVKQSNRREITKQVYSLLQETNPLTIIRLDIKGFYENIDLGECIDPILEGTLQFQHALSIRRNEGFSTLTVQCPAFAGYAKLRLTRSTTLLSAYCTYTNLRPISLGLQRFQATHNPQPQSSPQLLRLLKSGHVRLHPR